MISSFLNTISIVASSIEKIGFYSQRIDLIKDAINLILAVIELKKHQTLSSMFSSEDIGFLPKHWQERTNLLKIVLEHSKNMTIHDIGLVIDQSFIDSDNELHINKCTILKSSDKFEEIDCIFEIIQNHDDQTVCVIVPSILFARLLGEKFEANNMDCASHIKNPETNIADVQKKLEIEFCDAQIVVHFLNALFSPLHHQRIVITNFERCIQADVMILANMDEESLKFECHGSRWIHNLFRKKLKLETADTKKSKAIGAINRFSNIAQDTFILFSQKLSHVFMNLSVQPQIYYRKFETLNVVRSLSEYKIDLPRKLSAKDLERLSTNFPDFVERSCLGLYPVFYNEEKKQLRLLYKELLNRFLEEDNTAATQILAQVSQIDLFRYYQCINILQALTQTYGFLISNKTKNLIYEYDLGITTLYAPIDMIVGSTMFFFRIFEPKQEDHFLQMVSFWIASKSLGTTIDEIQVLNMHGTGSSPIEATSIKIDHEMIEGVERRIRELFCHLSTFLR